MALKSTVYKASLNVSDMDRHYYAEHALTLARHPSETDERMMVRLVAFALYADERLEFGRGLSTEDEPALWLRDYDGSIRLWVEVGLPDERILRKACSRADRVVLLAYGGRGVGVWWDNNRNALARLDKLEVLEVPQAASEALTGLVERGMQLQATIQDGVLWLSGEGGTVELTVRPPGGSSA
ncbi:MAG: YaeQ family protein [Rhodocyclaceae bacterium]|nr:YaeQ family protein [Rhodocyclaceae bacterium]